jgi:hypothetical protein
VVPERDARTLAIDGGLVRTARSARVELRDRASGDRDGERVRQLVVVVGHGRRRRLGNGQLRFELGVELGVEQRLVERIELGGLEQRLLVGRQQLRLGLEQRQQLGE